MGPTRTELVRERRNETWERVSTRPYPKGIWGYGSPDIYEGKMEGECPFPPAFFDISAAADNSKRPTVPTLCSYTPGRSRYHNTITMHSMLCRSLSDICIRHYEERNK